MKIFIIYCFIIFVSLKGTDSVVWPCTESRDCSETIALARCSHFNFCQCPAGFVFSSDFTKCLPQSHYGVACEESVQCAHMLTGASCENGICSCAEGFTYLKSRCRKLVNLHESCSEDIDCSFSFDREAVVCRENTCECALGFYQRAENVCRRISIENEPCLVNADCQGGINLECSTQICRPKTRSISVQTDSVSASISYENEKDLYSTYSKLNKSGSLSRKLSDLNSPLRDEDVQFGDICEESQERKPCVGLPYSICQQGLCLCQEGYFASNGLCKAELGEVVESAEYCGAGEFRNGKCLCEKNRFYGANMRVCVKTALGINTSCTVASQCSPYNAICPVLSPKRCECPPYTTYDAKNELCDPKEGLGEYCETEQHCSVPNTMCTPQQTCACRPTNYIEKDGECKPGKGSQCVNTSDCGFENAECKEIEDENDEKLHICECKEKFVFAKETCKLRAEKVGDECQEKEQCTPLLGELGGCIDSKCTCADHLHFKDGQCHQKIALTNKCQRSSQCFVSENPDRVECRNEQCQCKYEYSTDVEKQNCVKLGEGKNSSSRPSPLKVITMLLVSSAALITGTAIADAYLHR